MIVADKQRAVGTDHSLNAMISMPKGLEVEIPSGTEPAQIHPRRLTMADSAPSTADEASKFT